MWLPVSSRLHVPRAAHAGGPGVRGHGGWEGASSVIWGMEKLEQASLAGIGVWTGTNVKHPSPWKFFLKSKSCIQFKENYRATFTVIKQFQLNRSWWGNMVGEG